MPKVKADLDSDADIVEQCFGVYLLYSLNPKYKGKIYIGFTVNPNRRIKQHNKGVQSGGARKTSYRGPWDMVLIVHGFPNGISALRFEWAWQHPERSRRLRHMTKKKPREKLYDFHLRILTEMLQVGPWNRLPLSIRWLKQEYARDFPVDKCPPLHMPVVYGPMVSKKVTRSGIGSQATGDAAVKLDESFSLCFLCDEMVSSADNITCLGRSCCMEAHTICLATHFLGNSQHILPVEGRCPSCSTQVLWGDLVRKKLGCFRNLDDEDGARSSDSD